VRTASRRGCRCAALFGVAVTWSPRRTLGTPCPG
jgi:hypothetical protein